MVGPPWTPYISGSTNAPQEVAPASTRTLTAAGELRCGPRAIRRARGGASVADSLCSVIVSVTCMYGNTHRYGTIFPSPDTRLLNRLHRLELASRLLELLLVLLILLIVVAFAVLLLLHAVL